MESWSSIGLVLHLQVLSHFDRYLAASLEKQHDVRERETEVVLVSRAVDGRPERASRDRDGSKASGDPRESNRRKRSV